jgi:uncharacterized protein (TIGR03118 family)
VTVAASALLLSAIAAAQSPSPGPPNRQNVGFIETDLVANKSPLTDSNGIVHTPKPCTTTTTTTTATTMPPCVDLNLLNPWGLVASPTSPFWVSDNGKGVSTLYNDDTVTQAFTFNPRVVFIPTPGNPTCTIPPAVACGTPTGVVFNIAPASPPAFQISGFTSAGVATTKPSTFIFATEDGTIVGWSSAGVNPLGFNPSAPFVGNYGIIAVDNSNNPVVGAGAVYKGLAIATNSTGKTLLYATNFRAGAVEVYDTAFNRVMQGAFEDKSLPAGYAPFNIVLVGNRLIVTYAVQNSEKHDDVAGPGHGVVNSFDLGGHGLKRLVSPGRTSLLNSPWGVALAPQNFGALAGALLIGNFGDGHINGYDPTTGKFIGTMHHAQLANGLPGKVLAIDGLWSLRVGGANNGNNGNTTALYFTAGPNGEQDGLFGAITPTVTPPYPFPGP